MAHSLRSKSKKVTKKVKCFNPNSDYFKAAQERTLRLAEKQKENLLKQEQLNKENKDQDESNSTNTTTNPLDIPVEELVKVKTHGWRNSRASNYKKKVASKKKNKTMKF
ncbi:hypothetical protein DAPK24_041120 [Pichia kluyveri]|uniref:DUF2423 domain-containing protein n=1 Tax=Pichia kluyveri TaxID=36015 RepID=A0AAV5R7H9_PICKL|nr:hypothetical protein DAPK24_041120 [Pichia kluyveri]